MMNPNITSSEYLRGTAARVTGGTGPQIPVGEEMNTNEEALAALLMENRDQLKGVTSWKEFGDLLVSSNPQKDGRQIAANLKATLMNGFNTVLRNDPRLNEIRNLSGRDQIQGDLEQQFENAFVKFLGSYQAPQSGDMKVQIDAFTTQYQAFLGLGKDGVTTQDYEQAFSDIFGTKEGFMDELQLFADQQIDENGFFLPNQSVEEWTETFNEPSFKVSDEGSTVKAQKEKTDYSDIMSLVKLMIKTNQVLQRLVVVVTVDLMRPNIAEQKRLTEITKRYGTWTQDSSKSWIGGTSQEAKDLRAELNAKQQNDVMAISQERDMYGTEAKSYEQFASTLNTQIEGRSQMCQRLLEVLMSIAGKLTGGG